MIIALFGGDGRALGTHAAILLARAAASVGTETTLVHVAGPHESGLRRLGKVQGLPRVVELRVDAPSFVEDLRRATEARHGVDLTVLDLPSSWLNDCPVDLAIHARVVAVGPTRLECSIATSAIAGVEGDHAPWLVACGARSMKAFALVVRETMSADGIPVNSARLIARGLPGPRQDVTAPDAGAAGLDAPSIHAALDVLGIVVPGAVRTPLNPVHAHAFRPLGIDQAERHAPQERLRDLADAIDAAEGGGYPSDEELASAPVLEEWELGMRPVPALIGRVQQHPDIPSNRQVRTSEVYLSDHRTWARTYSRLYRLGRPAGPGSGLQ